MVSASAWGSSDFFCQGGCYEQVFGALGALLIIFGLVKLALAMIQKHGEDA